MADIKKIFNQEPYGCVHTAIGELCVFYITAGGQEELHKEIGKPISKCETLDFVRKFVRHICFPRSSLKDEKYKPDKPILTNDDISSLTEVDLEAIAKLYIEHNEYLFKKTLWKKKKDNKGETVNYTEYGEIEYPRHEKESYMQYLTRLSIKEEEKQKKQMEKMFFQISGFKNFSNTLGESIRNTLSLGDSLRKTMEGIRPIQIAPIRPIERKLPNIDWSEIQEERLKPFNELSERLDKLIDTSVQAAEFMIKANEIQTRIAGEIKSSGDQTTKFSMKNIRLTFIVIILTIISLAVFVYSIFRSNDINENQRIEIQKNVNVLVEKLTDINNSITVVNDKAFELLEKNYVIVNESLRLGKDSLKKKSMEQEKKIDEMKSMILRQDKKLEELEKNLMRNGPTN